MSQEQPRPATPKNVDRRFRFTGREGVRQFMTMARRAFPDIRFKMEHRTVDDAGNVLYVWSAKGRHTGDLEGFPATGEEATLVGLSRNAAVPFEGEGETS